MAVFTSTSRHNGESDWEVIYALACDRAPETTFTYSELTRALAADLIQPEEVARDRVYRAVSRANRTLLQERKRYLAVVRNVGYRVIRSEEHLPVALRHKSEALTLIKRGAQILDHTNLEELTPLQRSLHEGQMMIMAGLSAAIADSERRHARQESVIEQLTGRIERLEQGH